MNGKAPRLLLSRRHHRWRITGNYSENGVKISWNKFDGTAIIAGRWRSGKVAARTKVREKKDDEEKRAFANGGKRKKDNILPPRSDSPDPLFEVPVYFTSGNTWAPRCTALSPRNFLSVAFLNGARSPSRVVELSRGSSRRRAVISLSRIYSRAS